MASKDGNREVTNYADLYDIPRATIGEIRDQIKLSLKYRQHRGAIVLVSEAGIGKSSIVHQIAREEGYRVCDIRTAHYGLMGAGIPSTKNQKKDFFDIVLPSIFPQPGEKAIVMFDELNQGLQHAIAMFFSLIEDRRMFNYTLPDDTLVVGMMNPAGAKYSVTMIENNAALRRRIKWFYGIFSYSEWLKHAQSEEFHASDMACLGEKRACHPLILDFFTANPRSVYDEIAREANKQYCCPAVTQTLSLDCYNMERAGMELDSDEAQMRLAGSCGVTLAKRISDYASDPNASINPKDVLTNFKKVKRRVRRLAENKQDKLAELNHNVVQRLFTLDVPAEKVAPNLLDFFGTLPNSMRQTILSSMNSAAKAAKKMDYNEDLIRVLSSDYADEWIDITVALDASDREVNKALGS